MTQPGRGAAEGVVSLVVVAVANGNPVTAAIGLRQSQSGDYMQKPFSVAVLLARISCVALPLSISLSHSVCVFLCVYLEDTQIEHISVIANWNRSVGGDTL